MFLHQKRSRRRLAAKYCGLFAVVVFVVCGVTLNESKRDRHAYIHDAEISTAYQAQTFAENASANIKRLDALLMELRSTWRFDRENFSKVVGYRQADISDIGFQVAVIGPDGYLAYSSISEAPSRIYLGDREHFKVHVDSRVDKLFISKPLEGKVSGKISIQFTRPILDLGQFLGVILVSVNPDTFIEVNNHLDLGGGDILSIVDQDSFIFGRFPDSDRWIGNKLSGLPFLSPQAPIRGNYQKISQTDAVERIFGYYSLKEYKLNFIVARSLSGVQAQLYEHQEQDIAAAVLAVIVSGVMIFLLYRSVLTRTEMVAELRVAAAAFESQQGMIVTDADSVILRINRAFTDSTGYTPEDVIGQTPRLLKSGKHDDSFYRDMWDSISHSGGWQGEIWDRRKNGEIYPKWLSITAVRGADGKVTHYVGTHADITERKKSEERINDLAFFDQLTRLPNRPLLLDRLRQATADSKRSDRYGAVLMLDLDHFKALNDTRGHAEGDILLQRVAGRLVEIVRSSDTVARLGGDEFVVVLTGVEGNSFADAAMQVEGIAQKIVSGLGQSYALASATFHCSASVGVALFQGDAVPAEDLLKQADLAMYQAKNAGGNSFTFFDRTMEVVALEYARAETDLRSALMAKQFELYFQPLIDGGSRRIVGAEALIRWNHPTRGMVSPAEFIPHAERTGLILPLGTWVMENACEHLAVWAKQPELADLVLSINVSAKQFQAPDFSRQMIEILDRTGANPRRLKIELTESLFAGNFDDIVAAMSVLQARGITFALDDFGTGFSSLSYLSRLPLDQLKIDRSFVAGIEPGDANVAICASIIGLARNLKLKVVAEGVESEAEAYFLGAVHRCDMLQGYLFSRPVPRSAFEDLCSAPPSFVPAPGDR